MLQMIYASAATREFSPEELDELLTKARTNNSSMGVSGMLLYHEGSFLQILEGPENAVMKLYHIIEKDDRHGDVRLLLKSEVEEPSFPDWKMGFCDTTRQAYDEDSGFIDFFRTKDIFHEEDGDRAKAVLLQFKEGRWRQAVETGNSVPA